MLFRQRRPLATLFALLAVLAAAPVSMAQIDTAALPPMRELRSIHYRIHTDLDATLSTDLAEQMDGVYDEYARRLADFHDTGAPDKLEVYLFDKAGDYARFTQNHFANTGGIFVAGKENLLAAFLEGQGRDALRRTLQHEAFHQFAYNRISGRMPIWMNEGLAQYFEEGLWDGAKLNLGEVPPRRLRQLQADVAADRLTEFKPFLATSPLLWSKNLSTDAGRGATQYNQAWAMVQFLITAENASFRQRLLDCLKRMHDGEDSDDAFREAFSSNLEGFRHHFNDWEQSVTATPMAMTIERQNVLADLLVSLYDQGKHFEDFQVFRHTALTGRYQLNYTRGDVHWKTDSKFDIYFTNTAGQPLTPQQLYFAPQTGDGPRDILCQYDADTRLRTHFYRLAGAWRHESLIEEQR